MTTEMRESVRLCSTVPHDLVQGPPFRDKEIMTYRDESHKLCHSMNVIKLTRGRGGIASDLLFNFHIIFFQHLHLITPLPKSPQLVLVFKQFIKHKSIFKQQNPLSQNVPNTLGYKQAECSPLLLSGRPSIQAGMLSLRPVPTATVNSLTYLHPPLPCALMPYACYCFRLQMPLKSLHPFFSKNIFLLPHSK